MIRTMKIEVSAAAPHLPLQPIELFEGSAATFVIVGVPRAHGKQEIGAVAVQVANPDGDSTAYAATRVGSSWVVTVPATAFGGSGFAARGVVVSASGTDESGGDVDCWILGAGDLVVMRQDGMVRPGERKRVMTLRREVPDVPSEGDVAVVGGIVKYFNGVVWTAFANIEDVSVRWDHVTNKPTAYPAAAHRHPVSQINDFPSFRTVNGESITGMGDIKISGGWKNLGYVAFEDDSPPLDIAEVANKSLRQYQSGDFGYYGEVVIPDQFDFAEFFVEADLVQDDRYYSLSFPDHAMVYSRYGTMWQGSVTLTEIVNDWKTFFEEPGYLIKISIRKTDSYYFVEVN